jgi:hypothetical protein
MKLSDISKAGVVFILLLGSCKKYVQIPPPVSSITTSEVFADSADANSGILGIYTQMINGSQGGFNLTNGALTFYGGSSSDELVPYYASGDQFYPNELTAQNGNNYLLIWEQAYAYINQANACIQGLQASTTLSPSIKNEFLGEATFLRALCYFYLAGYYGDVPYITSATDWAANTAAPRTAKAQVYAQIVADLETCAGLLPADYSISGGERVRANKWAALALLAKTYSYTNNWAGADSAASAVINSGNFALTGPEGVFLANSNEAILQWAINSKYSYVFNATPEAYNELPSGGGPPLYYLSSQLLAAFEPGDLRYTDWVESINPYGTTYYYPYKYKLDRIKQLIMSPLQNTTWSCALASNTWFGPKQKQTVPREVLRPPSPT